MEVIKYKYSPYQNWSGLTFLLGLILVLLCKLITDSSGNQIWQVVVPFILLLSIGLIYFCRKLFLPFLRGETVLELDNEKLQYFVYNKTVYWKDVLYLDSFQGKTSLSIRFALEEGVDIKISTKYIAGNDRAIYDTITEYFEKYKKG